MARLLMDFQPFLSQPREAWLIVGDVAALGRQMTAKTFKSPDAPSTQTQAIYAKNKEMI